MRCERCYSKVRVRYLIGLYTYKLNFSELPKEIKRYVCTTCKKDIVREMKRLIGDRLV